MRGGLGGLGGVIDPLLLFSSTWTDPTEETRRCGMARMIGDPKTDAAPLQSVSRLKLAPRIQRPLLLAHAGLHTRVPIVHGEALRDALKPHNGDVEWLVYENEGHGWDRPQPRIDFWMRVDKFLARHLPGGSAQVACRPVARGLSGPAGRACPTCLSTRRRRAAEPCAW